MGIFRDIPNDILYEEQQRIKADDWAAVERKRVAAEWAEQQRRALDDMLRPTTNTGLGQQPEISSSQQPDTLGSEINYGAMRPAEPSPMQQSLLDAQRQQQQVDPGEALQRMAQQIQYPALEAATYLGSRGIEGTNPAEGIDALRQGWEQRGEVVPGQKGIIEAVTSPLNLLPVGAAGRAVGEAYRLGAKAPEAISAGLKAPALSRMLPAAGLEDVGKLPYKQQLASDKPVVDAWNTQMKAEIAAKEKLAASGGLPPPEPPTAVATQPPGDGSFLPTIKSTQDILASAYQSDLPRKVVDRLTNPIGGLRAGIAQSIGIPQRDVFTQGLVLRESILGDWRSGAVGAMSRLRQLGDSHQLFAVDKAGRADVAGQRIALNDVLQHPKDYTLTPQQQDYVDTIHKLYDDRLKMLTAEGIDVKQLGFEEGAHYVGRKVVGKADPAGNIELATIGTGQPGRLGAKAGFEKSRSFATEEEAIKEGFRYMKPEDALDANLQAAGRLIADKRLTDFVLSNIPYRTNAAPEELLTARDYLKDKMAALGKMKLVVNRGYRGERVPPQTISSIGKFFPDQAKTMLDANITRIESNKLAPIERSLLQKVEAEWPQLRSTSEAAYRRAESLVSKAKEKAGVKRFGEGTVQAPALQNKFFAEADAKRLNQILDLERRSPVRGLAESVSWANALPRMLMTTVDIGASLIQGQIALFSHPLVWAKTFKQSLNALVSEKGYQQFLATNANTIRDWSKDGAIFTPSEFTTSLFRGGLASKLPGVRTAIRPFARSFEAFLNAGRIYGLQATEHLAQTTEDRVGLAKFWNEMSGVVDTARMGISPTQREIESAVLFAPRYKRAGFALVADVAQGGLRGKMARDAIGKYLLAGLATYVGTAKALGQEPDLDPRSRKFLTVNVWGQDVGLGGTYFSLAKLMGRIALEPQKSAELAGGYLSGLSSPVAGTFAEVALPRLGTDTKTGKAQVMPPYVYNNPKDVVPRLTKAVAGENGIPIWLQAAIIDQHADREAAAVSGAVEFLGGRTVPMLSKKAGSANPALDYMRSLRGGAGSVQSPVLKYLHSAGGK